MQRWLLWLLLPLVICFSGCVQADLAIEHHGQTGGQLTYNVNLPTTDPKTSRELVQQVQHLGGKVTQRNETSVRVAIPFETSYGLATALSQIVSIPYLAGSSAHAEIFDQNWLLFVRERLRYDIDLRPLGVQSSTQEVLVAPQALLDFTVSLKTLWGARPVTTSPLRADTLVNPNVTRQGDRLSWHLVPGYLNHLEAVYLYPSPLGWGTLAILGLLALGYWGRDRSQKI
jgi:hypothetical protein